eukprot:scaffold9336_cov133-Isochrysis_galbana.AAC.11
MMPSRSITRPKPSTDVRGHEWLRPSGTPVAELRRSRGRWELAGAVRHLVDAWRRGEMGDARVLALVLVEPCFCPCDALTRKGCGSRAQNYGHPAGVCSRPATNHLFFECGEVVSTRRHRLGNEVGAAQPRPA